LLGEERLREGDSKSASLKGDVYAALPEFAKSASLKRDVYVALPEFAKSGNEP
jgi:hypothetical protein